MGAMIVMLIGLPLSIWGYEYARLGISPRLLLRQVWGSIWPEREGKNASLAPERREPTVTPSFTAEPIGFRGPGRPMIGSVVIVDLDEDGAKDVIACDTTNDYVYWLRQEGGRFRDIRLGSAIRDPIRAEVVDLDRDGDRDILVAVIGVLTPTNRKVGSVVLLRNEGSLRFTNEILLTGLRRTVDARTGDLDGDGDLDIVVAVFGHFQGEILWMENDGAMHFTVHQLLDRAGGTDTPIVDLDGDGDLDIVALVSQEFEEIWLFINDGAGKFERLRIFDSSNDDFGSAGIEVVDMDRDGDLDVVFTNGDTGDTRIDEPRPWHALQWLENRGHFRFRLHEILRIPGAYDSKTIDLDGDGDLDIALSNQFNDWKDPAAPSLVWMENDGAMQFIRHDVGTVPSHLVAVDAADMDDDGDVDLVTAGMHVYPPFDRMGRITLWRNTPSSRAE